MRPKAIVIGGGFGGIAAALRTRKKGYDVTLIDRQGKLGGRAYVYERSGFTYDAGPTIITAPFLISELFSLFGKNWQDYLSLVPVEPWYLIRFEDGSTFRYGGTFEDILSEIEKFSPDDCIGYKELFKKCRDIFDVGFVKLGDKPFLTLNSMVKVAPDMMRLESHLTVYQLVSRYIKNEKLRKVFTFHPLLVGGNPFTTTSIYSLIHYLEREYGVWHCMGGTGSLVNALGKLMLEEGIEVQLDKTISKIITSNGKAIGVELAGGESISAEVIISNADPPFVYKNLLDKADRKKWTDKRIDQMNYSMGLFVLYFGTNKQYPDLSHHTILLGKYYKELLKNIFDHKILSDDFSLYLHAPTRSDSSLAPAGHECFYVLAPVPNLQGNVNWDVEGENFCDRIIDYLEGALLPDLREHIVDKFFVTPKHFKDNLLSLNGSAFSIQPTLFQSAYFRFHNKSEDVGGLYFVGAGTHPGAGLPGVLTSAKVLERILPEAGIGNSNYEYSVALKT